MGNNGRDMDAGKRADAGQVEDMNVSRKEGTGMRSLPRCHDENARHSCATRAKPGKDQGEGIKRCASSRTLPTTSVGHVGTTRTTPGGVAQIRTAGLYERDLIYGNRKISPQQSVSIIIKEIENQPVHSRKLAPEYSLPEIHSRKSGV